MAWRIADSIVRGEIDNRQKGRVVGRIWLLGREEPIELNLQGNGLRDIAGCLLNFSNPAPKPGDPVDLAKDQDGFVGDITASKKVFVLDCSIEESIALSDQGLELPKHHANCLYIEWFSRRNGRVVIETTDFDIRVGEPAWTMTEQELAAQVESTHEAFRKWLEDFNQLCADAEPYEKDSDGPMNEFQWEKFMRESDQKTEKLGEVMEKYQGHPDSQRLIAREMGWTWLEEELEAQERGILTFEDDVDDDPPFELPEPDPAREGIDWVRDEEGEIHHPVALRAFNLSIRLWHYCHEQGLLGENADADALDMTSQLQICSAKLAGALNGIAFDRTVDSGFVVAGLKRALNFLHQSMDATDRVHRRNILDAGALEEFRKESFDVRQDVLDLMKRHRELMAEG